MVDFEEEFIVRRQRAPRDPLLLHEWERDDWGKDEDGVINVGDVVIPYFMNLLERPPGLPDWNPRTPMVPADERPCSKISRPIAKRIKALPCCICGLSGLTQVDHLLPNARGGPSKERNLQPLCRQCNGRKSCILTNRELIELYIKHREKHIRYHTLRITEQSNDPTLTFEQLFLKCLKRTRLEAFFYA